ncbi:FRG domain-containing protein [Paenibacillus sp. FA6]|uniref:FRG domain-containing protein n=1 Tax=Paenibacillus sp. FA6 TaxID=3413029 RepID=UPI003F65A4FE
MGYSVKWKEFLDLICEIEDKTYMKRLWFRGHSNSSYVLKSGLFRDDHEDLLSYLYIEDSNYTIFNNLGSHIHNNLTDWELLFLMQHHGVKTRLLDWSESFAVALFFACANWDEQKNNARIWLLDPAELNRLSIERPATTRADILGEYEECLDDATKFSNNSIAIYPPRNNNRITRQRGTFTLQGNTLESLDEEFNGDLIKMNALSYIDLEPELKSDAIRYLHQCGIDYFTLFPDLDGLAKYANNNSTKGNKLRLMSRGIPNFNNDEIREMFFKKSIK